MWICRGASPNSSRCSPAERRGWTAGGGVYGTTVQHIIVHSYEIAVRRQARSGQGDDDDDDDDADRLNRPVRIRPQALQELPQLHEQYTANPHTKLLRIDIQ